MLIRVKRVAGYEGPLPRYETAGAAGMDLRAAICDDYLLSVGDRATLATGISLAIPTGYEGQVRPRSGLAKRLGLVAITGTIDADYRGEVCVILANISRDTIKISPGDRIAQLVITPVVRAFLVEADDLGETERGEGGFGSTGLR